jgi:3-(3-hydroxy-phenyl)propionate hydroxylase
MNNFTHGHVLFVGDAAHQVSPFGARGANSGIQDTDNLCWKLKLVIEGKAPSSLLDTYSEERVFAADENLLNSTRSTDFITPKSKMSLTIRNATLTLARDHAFARALVNSGRLSVPAVLTESRLNTPDTAVFAGDMVPGAAMDDAPMQENGQPFWLLERVGNRFMALVFVNDPSQVDTATARVYTSLADAAIPIDVVLVSPKAGAAPEGLRVFVDEKNRFAERFNAQTDTTYLIRPDQHVAARWRAFDAAAVKTALARATSNVH